MGPETGNNPCGWPVTSAYDIWYILADILRCRHNEVRIYNEERLWHGNNLRPIALIRIQHLLTSDYKKRWWDIYNAEHWILKLQSWFLVSQVERALSFQEQVIMPSVKSLSWTINFKCWNVKLKVECYDLMLAAQVECWGLKLIFGSLS